MRHGSLFSGIGGFDLAAQWMGWENVFHCEKNDFGQKILKYYWKDAISYDDIVNTTFTLHRGHIDILSGGFPCQPYSVAGKRLGKEDERHLFPEMLRAVREIRPRWVVGENVFGIVSWNDGLVFEEVHADLEREGYEVWAYVLPAVAVDAPHRRDRTWFIAHSRSIGCRGGNQQAREHYTQERTLGEEIEIIGDRIRGKVAGCGELTSDSNGTGLPCQLLGEQGKGKSLGQNSRNIQSDFDKFPSQSPICGRDDGLPRKLDGITFPKWRSESVKAYGNAIVPQMAYQLFKAIQLYESMDG